MSRWVNEDIYALGSHLFSYLFNYLFIYEHFFAVKGYSSNYKTKIKNRFILIANLHLINAKVHLGFSQTSNRQQLKDVIYFRKKPLPQIFSCPECVSDTNLKYAIYPKIRMRKPCKTLSHDFIPFET